LRSLGFLWHSLCSRAEDEEKKTLNEKPSKQKNAFFSTENIKIKILIIYLALEKKGAQPRIV
jgi:hypothetical protein